MSSMAQDDLVIEKDLFRLLEMDAQYEGAEEMRRRLRKMHHNEFVFAVPKSEEWSRIEIVFDSETQKNIDDFKRPKKSLSDLMLFIGPFAAMSFAAMLVFLPPLNYTLAAGCMLPAAVGIAKDWKSYVQYTKN